MFIELSIYGKAQGKPLRKLPCAGGLGVISVIEEEYHYIKKPVSVKQTGFEHYAIEEPLVSGILCLKGGMNMKPKKRGKKDDKPQTAPDMRDGQDVWGSYTGVPVDGGMPVQDADDL